MRCRVAELMGILLLALATESCGGDTTGHTSWGGTVDTLEGGGVRIVSPQEGLWTAETTWRLEEDLRIGSLESNGPDMFGQIGDLAVDGAGRVFVLEQQAHEIRVFDAAGTHIRTIGGEGSGPGELNISFGGEVILEPSGRIWVNNSLNRRWELFSAEGEPLASTPVMSGSFGGGTVLARDGAFYMRDRVRDVEGGTSRAVIVRKEIHADQLVAVDTIDAPPLPEGETVTASLSSGNNRLRMLLPVPFVQQPSFTFDPGGYFWVDPGEGYRLLALSPEHDTLRIIERLYDPVRVTAAEIDKEMGRFSTGPLAGSGTTIDRSRIPDHHPAFSRFRTDEANNLWVRRALGQDVVAWEVFDPDGRFLGAVESSLDLARLTVHVITADAVYGVFRDELDVPYVVRLRIVKGV